MKKLLTTIPAGQKPRLNTTIKPVLRHLLFFAILAAGSLHSCSKNDPLPPANTDTLPVTPVDSLPRDTVTLIRKLQVIYATTSFTDTTTVFSFYYDPQKRVKEIGIRDLGAYPDSNTLRFIYTGNQSKPSLIISPKNQAGNPGAGASYNDSTFFVYSPQGIIQKDSTIQTASQLGGTLFRQTMVREYQYLSNTVLTIRMSRNTAPGNPLTPFRLDTVRYRADSSLEALKVVYPNPISSRFARLEGFGYSSLINPLSKLNIGGLHYSWLFVPNDLEILGNTSYKTISNTNILPTYIDFASPRIPVIFFNSAYNSLGDFLYGDEFDLVSTEWPGRSKYPQTVQVVGSSSYPGDRFIYNYFY